MIDYRLDPGESPEFVRLYVVTQGRKLSGGAQLPLTAFIATVDGKQHLPSRLSPEEKHILQLCQGGCLSVAEVAGHTSHLPLSVVRTFLASLLETGYITVRPSKADGVAASAQTLRHVLDGLEAKFG
ncbi:DUF742 domain-containing protein [Streptomyces canus]|uniref:DUF742 domain-containing protein n=1 Tax=Streptomyces canus TaxID=58343 RepID=UPI003400B119